MQKYREAILYIVIIVIVFIYAVISVQPVIVNAFNIGNEINSKKVELADLERKIEALKTSQLEKMSMTEQVKKIYKPAEPGIDAETSFSVLFDDIIEMAKYNQVKVYAISYIYNPPEDEFVKGSANSYNVCQLNMQLISDYTDLQTFLEDIYKYPYLINVSKLEMAPYSKDKKILLINLQLKLYTAK